MNTVLITGVAGLIGSRFANFLQESNEWKVIGIDDLSGGYKSNIPEGVIFYERDVKSDLADIFEKYQIDYVYHFAAYAAEGLSPFIRKFNYENNLLATANIINNSIKYSIKRLVFTSSLAVYGHGEGGVFNEDQIPKPIDPYGVAKFACEQDIQIAGEQHGLDWCIIRPHNVYGVGQNIWDKYRNVLGIWMYQHLNNLPMTIFGDGKQMRAFSFIDDILEPLKTAALSDKSSREIINLGGVEEWTILDASKLLRKIIGSGEILHLEQRHEVKVSIPTFQKSIDLLGFNHKKTLESGLEEMWNWAKNQPMRSRFEWSEFELEKGIYSYWELKK